MEDFSKIENGSRRQYQAAIFTLAWPIFLEQVLTSLVNVVDSAMVGALGKVATASVAINYAPIMMFDSVAMALGTSYTSLVARSVGAQHLERAQSFSRQALWITIMLGIPFSVLWFMLSRQIPIWMQGKPEIWDTAEIYNRILSVSLVFKWIAVVFTAIYRGYGNSRTPMLINMTTQIMNVVGNFFMIYPSRQIQVLGQEIPIFGFGWGVAGAALSSAISYIAGGIILLLYTCTSHSEVKLFTKKRVSMDSRDLKEVAQIGVPALLERLTMTTAFVVVGSTIAALGTAALSAHNLSGSAESLSYMPGFAFGASATTLFGQAIGAKRYETARRFVVETIKLGTVIMAFMTVILFTCSTPIMSFFTPDEEVIAMGSTLLKILAVIQVPQMIAMVYSGALKGAGDSKSCFIIALVSMWGIRLLGTVFCVRVLKLGLTSACVCMCADNVVRFLLFYLRYRQRIRQMGISRIEDKEPVVM